MGKVEKVSKVSKVRLDAALLAKGLCSSRTEAKELIEKKLVFVNGAVVLKPSKTVSETDSIMLEGKRRFVSRGGEKLEGVLMDVFGGEERIKTHLQGKYAVDVGASTGGFTNCLLSYGLAHVDAVDVGTSQFHSSLLGDKRITLHEQQDIRTFVGRPNGYDIIVVDVSFISILSIVSHILTLGNNHTLYFVLIKPQFEVGKGNTKKGIVKDETLARATVSSIAEKIKLLIPFARIIVVPSRLQGGDGNQEYFLYIQN